MVLPKQKFKFNAWAIFLFYSSGHHTDSILIHTSYDSIFKFKLYQFLNIRTNYLFNYLVGARRCAFVSGRNIHWQKLSLLCMWNIITLFLTVSVFNFDDPSTKIEWPEAILTKIDHLGLCRAGAIKVLTMKFKARLSELSPKAAKPPKHYRNFGRQLTFLPPPMLLPNIEKVTKLEEDMIEYLGVEGSVNKLFQYVVQAC